MLVPDLLDQLTRSETRTAALDALTAAGGDAVAPLIATLLDEQSPVEWSDAGIILRRIGAPAFWPLADAIATAPSKETRRRCSWAFQGFGADLIDLYAQALSHSSSRVREEAALGVQYCREGGLPAVPALLPLLADPDPEVRQRAIWALSGVGDVALPALQQVRDAGPGRLRAAALTAIAEVAGDKAFSPADRAAVERLIRIKLLTERPEGPDACGMCGPWLALPTGDQAAVLDALKLSDARPATMKLGFAAFVCDSHGMADDDQQLGRVFVTPQLAGWTLVLGPWYARWGTSWKKEIEATQELSAQFGRAQAYFHDEQTLEGSWVICDGGEVVRAYNYDKPRKAVGERLPVEQGKVLSVDELSDKEFDALPDDYESCDALQVAAAMSISPEDFGPDTPMIGHGVLALTKKGRKHGVPKGALPI